MEEKVKARKVVLVATIDADVRNAICIMARAQQRSISFVANELLRTKLKLTRKTTREKDAIA